MNSSPPPRVGFADRIGQFLDHSRVKGHSDWTIRQAASCLRRFSVWCEERALLTPSDVTRPVLERYQRHLFHHISPRTERPLSLASQHIELRNINAFYKWMVRQRLMLYNPAADLEIPRRPDRLPRAFLSVEETERVMTRPNVSTPLGLRDRAILETLYSTGLRRMEVRRLRVDEVDLEHGLLMVREGKGRRDRWIPIGERACRWIRAYLHESRPHFVSALDPGTLFLTHRGKSLSNDGLYDIVKRHLEAADIRKGQICHLFRHTCATQMLENGADLRFIQAMMGHKSLDTTSIYTRVVIQKLKEVHTLTHPGAKLTHTPLPD